MYSTSEVIIWKTDLHTAREAIPETAHEAELQKEPEARAAARKIRFQKQP